MYNIVLSIIPVHVPVMGKTDRKKNLQSQTKIVGILPLNSIFFLLNLSYLLSLPMLFIAVHSPNLVHQHWKGQKTVKCPNNFGLKTTGKISIKYNSSQFFLLLFLYLSEFSILCCSPSRKSSITCIPRK